MRPPKYRSVTSSLDPYRRPRCSQTIPNLSFSRSLGPTTYLISLAMLVQVPQGAMSIAYKYGSDDLLEPHHRRVSSHPWTSLSSRLKQSIIQSFQHGAFSQVEVLPRCLPSGRCRVVVVTPNPMPLAVLSYVYTALYPPTFTLLNIPLRVGRTPTIYVQWHRLRRPIHVPCFELHWGE